MADAASPNTAQPETPQNVFIAFSFGEDVLVQQDSYQLFRKSMSSYPRPLQLFGEYLDLVRFPERPFRDRLAQYLKEKYSTTRIDLVVCFAFPALRFWLDYGSQLFPNAPVLFMGVETRRLHGLQLGPSVTGLTFNFDDRELLKLALQLHPDTRHVFLVGGSTEYEQFWMSQRLSTLKAYKPGLTIDDMSSLAAARLSEALSRLPPNSIVIFQDLYRDAAGRYFQGEEAVNLVCRSSNAPVYGFYADYVGKGLVGGRVLDRETAPRAAKSAMRLLSGEKPATVAIQAALSNLNLFDSRELRRWHIDKGRLPKGSLVLFEKQSFWELYKWSVLAVALLCALETALLFALFVQLSRGKKADLSVKRLSGQILNAQEQERGRISRELHDDFGQQIAVIGMGLSSLERQVALSPAAAQTISQVEEKLFTLANSMRNLSHELHPAVLDHAGLAAALRTHCSEFNAVYEIKADSVVDPDPISLPSEVALCLYRVCQESLRNVVKHSQGTDAHVRVKAGKDFVELSVTDNGAGFDVNAIKTRGGLGLLSMKERVRLLGGTLDLSSRPNSGTVLKASIPLKQS
ncbi:MAG: histidine kinase [Acidobacteriota bacterium]|nr:histidine kinase [Acidobacteriota bacterium]